MFSIEAHIQQQESETWNWQDRFFRKEDQVQPILWERAFSSEPKAEMIVFVSSRLRQKCHTDEGAGT
jgi:hypothetical protein